jgi:hypothetical protein
MSQYDVDLAFQRIWQHRRFSEADLATIVDATHHPASPHAAGYLSNLSSRHPEACRAIEEMAASPSSESRLTALLCLARNTPPDTTLSVLRRLIADPDPHVRDPAAMRAAELHRHELSDDLSRVMEIESNPSVRQSYRIACDLLRDGYAIQTMPDGHRELYALCRTGIVTTSINEAQLQEIGLAEYVRQWRRF